MVHLLFNFSVIVVIFFPSYFSFSYSCGYRRAFEEYERIIKDKHPKIIVIGENHSPNFIRLAIAQTLSFGKFVVIGLIVSSINPFSYFGMATPTYWNMLSQHRLYGSMMIFFICKTLESYLMSTGAFEITYNGLFTKIFSSNSYLSLLN